MWQALSNALRNVGGGISDAGRGFFGGLIGVGQSLGKLAMPIEDVMELSKRGALGAYNVTKPTKPATIWSQLGELAGRQAMQEQSTTGFIRDFLEEAALKSGPSQRVSKRRSYEKLPWLRPRNKTLDMLDMLAEEPV